MSGGSLDYVYGRVEDASDTILNRSKKPLHTAFAKHLKDVAVALHDLEWVLSGDTSEPDEEQAIRKCINKSNEIKSAIEEAEIAKNNLEMVIKNANK